MEATMEETGETTGLEVSLTVHKQLRDVWAALMTPEGNEALLGEGGRLGSKGDDWRSADGAYGVTRSFHPMEQIRFSWHADDDAPRTVVDLQLHDEDGPLPGRGSARHPGRLQPCHRLRLVSGRAAEPGRLVQHPSSLRQRAAKPCPSALCRSPGLGLTGRRLHVRPRQAAKSPGGRRPYPGMNELWMRGPVSGPSLTWNKPAGQEVTRN